MPLPPGSRFGSYEIVSQLGVGGMGEVYRARDGEHLVMLLSPKYASPSHYNLVINWFEESRQKVPGR